MDEYHEQYTELVRSGYWDDKSNRKPWKQRVDKALRDYLVEVEWAEYLIGSESGNEELEIRRGD